MRTFLGFLLFFALYLQTSIAGCPSGFAEGPNPTATYNCYRVFSKDTWSSAEKNCQSYGGHLASVPDETLNQFFGDLDGWVSLWLGGSSMNVGTWTWSDGSSFSYSNWANNQPDPNGGNCLYLFSDDHTWYNDDCTNTRPYLCEAPSDNTPSLCPIGYANGPSPSNPFNCYKQFTLTVGSAWMDAESDCQNRGGHLASVTNAFIHNLLVGWAGEFTSYVGGRTPNPGFSGSYNWSWSDGSAFSYTNWGYNQPETQYIDWDCISLSTLQGKWVNLPCGGQDTQNYFCEIPQLNVTQTSSTTTPETITTPTTTSTTQSTTTATTTKPTTTILTTIIPTTTTLVITTPTTTTPTTTTTTSTTTTTTTPNNCPSGFTGYSNKCYQVLHELDFNSAVAQCENLVPGANLASIHSQAQNTFLATLASTKIAKNGPYYGWLGMQKSQNTWAWLDGTSVNYTNWGEGQPFNQFGYDCVAFYTDAIDNDKTFGYWEAQACNQVYKNAICEVAPNT